MFHLKRFCRSILSFTVTVFFNLFSSLQVDYIHYADEIADEVGCKPKLVKLFFSDPALALKCFFGPCTPPQFRIMGPNAWAGAKKAIEDAPGNVIYATKTRVLKQREDKGNNSAAVYLKLLVLLVMVAAILIRFYQEY